MLKQLSLGARLYFVWRQVETVYLCMKNEQGKKYVKCVDIQGVEPELISSTAQDVLIKKGIGLSVGITLKFLQKQNKICS